MPIGFKHSAETRLKMSLAAMGNTRALNHRPTEATREKIRGAMLGRTISEAAREKLRLANIGKKHSKETKAKMSAARRGPNGSRWKGGRVHHTEGYVLIYSSAHPAATGQGYVPEHRLVAESALGRILKPGEVVHHVNRKRADNRNCNLLVCRRGFHVWIHRRMKERENAHQESV